ncbi:NAD-dependent epimerase/dehydratase family protein [Hymenobacter wooponensis]|uniref:NAD-dependent epimerase/dehydratase family protein n=1 Tax=Hymenobacter wooponensis TaxID=1525360 RepID=A0A4Z0MUS9_9BACT|nr:NAD-dependent epimerase/dehydratase family protein [Hymenobacter wooponensis]TGD82885.1 NAD-dependent epimerase/dehydratase family protein [Hymenobacter wooponensis]
MTIAIIGSNSLLAEYLIEGLAPQHELILFGRRSAGHQHAFHYFNYPDSLPSTEQLMQAECIFYTAGAGVQSAKGESNAMGYAINALLPLRLLTELEDAGWPGKWISFGTSFEIGATDSPEPVTEESLVHSTRPSANNYTASKRILTRFIGETPLKIKAYHLVLPAMLGAKDRESSRLVPYLVRSLANGEEVTLGSGQQERQYIHALDIVALCRLLAEGDYTPGLYTVGRAPLVKVADLIHTIFQAFGQDASTCLGTSTRRDDDMKVLLLSGEKISREIPEWPGATITLQQAVAEYLA